MMISLHVTWNIWC